MDWRYGTRYTIFYIDPLVPYLSQTLHSIREQFQSERYSPTSTLTPCTSPTTARQLPHAWSSSAGSLISKPRRRFTEIPSHSNSYFKRWVRLKNSSSQTITRSLTLEYLSFRPLRTLTGGTSAPRTNFIS